MPVEWAQTMMNLAIAYSNVRGNSLDGNSDAEQAENLEQAIDCCQQALTVITHSAMPVEWAQTMGILANAYKNRIRGNRAENIKQAIDCYQSSLEIYDPKLFPDNCRRIARSMGNLYTEQNCWTEAISTYYKALQAAEVLYQSANLLDGKAAELTATDDLYRRAAYALARTGNLQAAALTLEQGRARGLSETLERDRSDLTQLQKTNSKLFTQYQDITAQLRNLEAQQRSRLTSEERHSLTPEALRTEALQLRQTLTEAIEQIRQIEGYTDFLAQPDFDDIQQAVHPGIPLVYLVPTPTGSLALIITAAEIISVWLDEFTDEKLLEILHTWLNVYGKPRAALQIDRNDQYNDQSEENLQKAYRQVEKVWRDAIDQVTHQLWDLLMAPLIAYLKQQQFKQATLIPTGYLNLLPLHAAWTEDPTTPTGRRYALDEIHCTYAPNARSINAATEIAQRTGADSILAIDNPRKDLPNSSREVTAAVASFPQPKVLQHEQATVESVLAALPHCNILHLSCHGTADLGEPLTSGLAMSDGLLTLRQLLDLKLGDQSGIRLAVLSACETGLTGIELADEAIGLPTGLLQAGVAGVVASLWSVSDLSTMMLLVRFYDYWRNENLEPAAALRQAQKWVRDTTNGEKLAYFKDFMPAQAAAKMPASTADYLYKSLILSRPGDRDFAHPFHWAAFSYTGV